MSLLVTGGLGFLGLQSAMHFLKRGMVWSPLYKCAVPLRRITLFDIPAALGTPMPETITSDARVQVATGDLTEAGVADELIAEELSVIHLASMVSGDTEADHVRGWQTNVEGQRLLLEAVRTRAPGARFLFTSSTASLGPVDHATSVPDDTTKLLPQNTYGYVPLHMVVSTIA